MKRKTVNQKQSNKGFTLVEVLVAILILAIIVVPLLSAFVMSAKTNAKARQTLRATTLAQNVMEELKAIHEEGNTIIMVTHNPSLTVYATRVINMLDGQIDTDVKTVADVNLPQPISVKIKKKSQSPVTVIPEPPKTKKRKKSRRKN